MLFNSYEFLLFLPIVFSVYWSITTGLTLQNVVIVLASYIFYAWWDVRFLELIIGITAVGYISGLLIRRFGAGQIKSRYVVWGGCGISLAVLALFKYYDFFAESTNAVLACLGASKGLLPLYRLVLPVGISFYTFQVLSYIIDTYRGLLPATRNPISFAAFVSFFPQLVAGPIERAGDLLPQIERPRRFDYAMAVEGLRLILWGMVKKVVVADSCGSVVDIIYGNPASSGFELWWATFLFAFQIYGDFSGYSDMAVGIARLFGIRLTANFRLPYLSRSISEFWQRWHISLTRWFRDYIYIPLGGSRRGRWRTWANTFVVFLVSGLWHGAGWTFVCWGVYFALCFLPGISLNRSRDIKSVAEWRHLPNVLLTFLLVLIGWVFFRSETIGGAFARLSLMATDFSVTVPQGGRTVIVYPLLLIVTEWVTRRLRHPLAFDEMGHRLFRWRTVRWTIYLLLSILVLYHTGSQEAFIYFQF